MDFTNNLAESMREFTTNGAFLAARSKDGVNVMTVGWGFVGYMWEKPYFVAVVRPQRHTAKILEHATSFTISVPFDKMKKELAICGTKSGADIDKGTVVQYEDARAVDSPVIKGCSIYYECRLTSAQPLDTAALPAEVAGKYYDGDYHIMVFGEIVSSYE